MSEQVDKIVTGNDLALHLEFERDGDSGWFTVHVVELPGCVSQGATRDEAKANIADALEAYMEVLLENAIRSQTPPSKATTGEIAEMLVRPHFEVRT
jgi:predicted RNase H-like HicB family nuclease